MTRNTKFHIGMTLAFVTLIAALIVYATIRGNIAEGSNDNLYEDPLNNAKVHMLNSHIYKPIEGYGQLTIETGLVKIKNNKHIYVRGAADGLKGNVTCYYGTYWSADSNAGCITEEGFDHLNFVSVVPYYYNGYINGWNIESGSYVIANISPERSYFYLTSAGTFAR
jgi:hypothetical protein